MKNLTKAEEQVMQVLWKLDKAFVKEIVAELPDPKPAYNTVSTIIRILEKKEVVGHESFGKSHRYFPRVAKKDYSNGTLTMLVKNYFEGSASAMLSALVQEKGLSRDEIAELQAIIDQNKPS